MNRYPWIVSLALLASLSACEVETTTVAPAANAPKVILIIGDGMDDQQVTIGRNYLVGSRGRLVLDGMPYRGAAEVQTVAAYNAAQVVYVGDSASGGTAMASGTVTAVHRIGVAADGEAEHVNIMELAQAAGMRTGIVTTARVTDATPAAFYGHISDRYCQMPGDMVKEDKVTPQDSTDCTTDYKANGGPGSLAEQLADSAVDIVLGGGARDFTEFVEGSDSVSVLQSAHDNGFAVISRGEELAALKSDGKVLGLFSPGDMPERWQGSGGRIAHFIERREGEVIWPEPFACEPKPEDATTPMLADMTRAALAHLDGGAGFMLMIESASIDKAAHHWRPCGHIGEMKQLDDTLQVVLDYAAAHPETLVLVTADHGQSAQLIPQVSGFAPQNFAPEGRFARILTPEGGIMGISYATNDSPLWEEHSGVEVPVYASGPRTGDLPEFLRQIDVFNIAATYLGLRDAWPDTKQAGGTEKE